MEDYIPSLKEIITSLVVTVLTTGGAYLWSKIKPFDTSKLPKWLIYGLALNALVTLLFITLNVINSFWPLRRRMNESFDHQTLVLDGYRFEGCKFTSCKLVVEGRKEFQIVNCTLSPDTQLSLVKRASIGPSVLMTMKNDPAFTPLVNQYLEFLKSLNGPNEQGEPLDLRAL